MSTVADLIHRCRSNQSPLSGWEAGFLADIERRTADPTPTQLTILERIANRIAPAELAARLGERIESLAPELVGDGPTTKGRQEWRFRGKGSLAVVVSGEDRGAFYDHEAGVGGDALEFIRYMRGGSPGEAIDWARRWVGMNAAPSVETTRRRDVAGADKATQRRDVAPTLDIARRCWAEAIPPAGTLVLRYLAARGLTLPQQAPIRFHPSCQRGTGVEAEQLPAMVALMSDPATGQPCGVHRTYLRADGTGKAEGAAKKMLGGAGIVRLVPDMDVSTGLGIAEGIETSLAIMQYARWRPVWAACSAGGISNFPVLAGIEALTVFCDRDDKGAGVAAARSCVERWTAAGREGVIQLPPAGTDWLDALIRPVVVETSRRRENEAALLEQALAV